MIETETSTATQTARDYYNSDDADRYYAAVWGGEDIHVGIYESDDDSIAEASRRTVDRMSALLQRPGQATRVLDLGSGYGGATRELARRFGCSVIGLNLSEVENRRARRLTAEQGLADRVEIIDGSFEDLSFSDATFDVVWSQDAILHGGNRQRVFEQVARVLVPGGQFLMTDPMQSDTCPAGVLAPILDRIHLTDLGSPAYYQRTARAVGLDVVEFQDLTANLTTHYTRVLEDTERRRAELTDIGPGYLDRMQVGLGHWIDGGNRGYLAWGILHFRKPTS